MHRSMDRGPEQLPCDPLSELQRQVASAVSTCDELRQRVDQLEKAAGAHTAQFVEILPHLHQQTNHLKRIADHFDPPPPDIVGSGYISDRLGCTAVWVTELVRKEKIPPHCIVPGTGFGKPWKFFRSKIDAWLQSR